MEISPAPRTWRTTALWIFAASYLPPLGFFIAGVRHCEVCREAWLTVVWFVQGCILPLLVERILSLPRADESWGIAIAMAVQLLWLVGWTWLASTSRVWFIGTTTLVLALSAWFGWIMDALIRS